MCLNLDELGISYGEKPKLGRSMVNYQNLECPQRVIQYLKTFKPPSFVYMGD